MKNGPRKPVHAARNSNVPGRGRLLAGWFPLLWFLAGGLLLFGRSLVFDYTYLDDHTLVLQRMDWLKSAGSIPGAFLEDAFRSAPGKAYYYRPMLTLSFIFDAMTGRGSLWMFHLTNILLHVASVWLLFRVLETLGFPRVRSFGFAMLFLAHPLAVQAIAWIPGRNDTLLAVFVLGSFLAWLHYENQRKPRWLILHLALYGLALFTKESALVLPVLAAGHAILFSKTPIKAMLPALAGWILLAVAWIVARQPFIDGARQVPAAELLGAMVYNLPALLPYLGKMLFPVGLGVFPVLRDMTLSMILGALGLLLLATAAWLARPREWKTWLFGMAWLLLFLLPSLVTIHTASPIFSEHRAYLPLAGLLMTLASLAPAAAGRMPAPWPARAGAALVATAAILSFLHLGAFRDRFVFWPEASETSPSNAFNLNNLGAMYYLAGNLQEAEKWFKRSLAVNPFEPMANSNAGLVCMNSERPAEAEKYFLEEIRINPTYDHAWFNLGLLYYNYARQEEGIARWEKLLTINPGYPDVYNALLFAYEKSGRPDDYRRIKALAEQNGIVR